MKQIITEISHEKALERIDKIARYIVKRRMGPAAIMTIESLRPLNFIASQLMYFLEPFAELFVDEKSYEEIALILEEQKYVKLLVKRIDELDAEFHKEQRAQNKIIRERKRKKRKEFFNKIFKKK
jgi:hypothetical protein